jgi:hypothetical protein
LTKILSTCYNSPASLDVGDHLAYSWIQDLKVEDVEMSGGKSCQRLFKEVGSVHIVFACLMP